MFGSSASLSLFIRRILVIWIGFLFALNLLFLIPHDYIPILSMMNYSLYLLMLIISIAIIIKDKYLKNIFFHLSSCFFITVIGLLGNWQDIFSTVYLQFYFKFYCFILFYQSWIICALYFVFSYIFWRTSKTLITFLSWGLGLLILADFWYKCLTIHRFCFSVGSLQLYIFVLRVDTMVVMFLLFYFYILITRNRPTGAFINSIAVGLLLMFSADILLLLATIYGINLYSIDLYLGLVLNIFLLAILFLRLIALFNEESRLREMFIFDPVFSLSVPVILSNKNYNLLLDQFLIFLKNNSFFISCCSASFFAFLIILTESPYVIVKLPIVLLIIYFILRIFIFLSKHRLKGQRPEIIHRPTNNS